MESTLEERKNRTMKECSTYVDGLPPIRYRRPLSVGAHNFTHLFNRRIGRHQVVKRQLILVVDSADVTSPRDLPKDQPESVHVSPLEGVKMVHVYRLFENLKAKATIVRILEKKFSSVHLSISRLKINFKDTNFKDYIFHKFRNLIGAKDVSHCL